MTDEFPKLANAVPGERRTIASSGGTISFYRAAGDVANARPPLLLIHSINAAGSSYEVRPLFERYCRERNVYSIDLPGFGFSDRSDRAYLVQVMVDAIHAMVVHVRQLHGGQPVDALALSLSSEFLARAARERPDRFRSLAFVSPTGFDKRAPYTMPSGTTRARPGFYRLLRFPLWDRGFFRLLTTRRSIRYFLERTWGSKDIDEGMVEYDYATTHQPGARFAPYYFVSGFLFSLDITHVYEALTMPVWLAHGVRGDFQDYSYANIIARRPNWKIARFETGALPHFEQHEPFLADYARFLDASVSSS